MKVEIARNPTGKKKQVETIELAGLLIFLSFLTLWIYMRYKYKKPKEK